MDFNYTLATVDEEIVENLSDSLYLTNAIARILVARGKHDIAKAKRFLYPSLDQLHDPFLMKDMEKAVDRIVAALRDKEPIMVHGDFDTDGLTATAVLVQALGSLGAKVSHFIPNRLEEGYGFRREGVEEALSRGAKLLITCDCGISSQEAVVGASSLGIDSIITDHHQPEGSLPGALAVINPKRTDCTYPFKELAGVGVATKLVIALLERIGEPLPMSSLLRMCALGTVADVVPLIGENRVITYHGLSLLPGSPNVGLRALFDVAGLTDSEIMAYDVSYRLAPRLNTMGRFGRQNMAIELFFTNNKKRAREIASKMNNLNTKRQQLVDSIIEQAEESITSEPGILEEKIFVLSDKRWHKGVIGVVASKLVDTFSRPVLIITLENGTGFGSGRSIEGFHLLDALAHCEDLLTRFGGHAMAAGFELQAKDLAEFRSRMYQVASVVLKEESLQPELKVDSELSFNEMDEEFENQYGMLEPFGYGNDAPLFLSRGLRLLSAPRILKEKHVKLALESNGKVKTALAWRSAERMSHLKAGMRINAIYSVFFNFWRGQRELQLDLKAYELE